MYSLYFRLLYELETLNSQLLGTGAGAALSDLQSWLSVTTVFLDYINSYIEKANGGSYKIQGFLKDRFHK